MDECLWRCGAVWSLYDGQFYRRLPDQFTVFFFAESLWHQTFFGMPRTDYLALMTFWIWTSWITTIHLHWGLGGTISDKSCDWGHHKLLCSASEHYLNVRFCSVRNYLSTSCCVNCKCTVWQNDATCFTIPVPRYLPSAAAICFLVLLTKPQENRV